MKATISESNRRREKQMRYNKEHGITPRAVRNSSRSLLSEEALATQAIDKQHPYATTPLYTPTSIAADVAGTYSAGEPSAVSLAHEVEEARRRMEEAAKRLDFGEAARWRDVMYALQERLVKEKR